MNKQITAIRELYNHIIKTEKLPALPLRVVSHMCRGDGYIAHRTGANGRKKPLNITIASFGCFGGSYVVTHEIAHYINILENNDATHGARFKKIWKDLERKYSKTALAAAID